MQSLRYDHLFLDVDGTAVGREDSPVGQDPRLIGLLQDYMVRGGTAGLVTGRGADYTAAVYELLGLNGPRVVEKGAALIMPDGTTIGLGELVEKEDVLTFLRDEGLLRRMVLEAKRYMVSMILPEFPYHDTAVLQRIFDETKPKFEARFPHLRIMTDLHSIDVENPEANKGKGILEYARRAGIDLGNSAAAGDSIGDWESFKVVGEAGGLVCYVGTSTDLAKKISREFSNTYITQRKRSNGTRELLEKLLV